MVTTRSIKNPSDKVENLLAAALGATLQAADVLVELGAETTQKVLARAQAAVRRYNEAADRGEAVVHRVEAEARGGVDRAVGTTVGWVDRQIVRRMAESMKPYLIKEFVPDVIDGVLPKVRTDVIPVVLADLAEDEQVQDMVAAQSRNAASRGVSEIRRASGDADDRVEDTVHKVLGRRGPNA